MILSCPGYCATELTGGQGRPASEGAHSILQVLSHGVEDSGKQFYDNKDIGIKNDIPDYMKQQKQE